MMTIRMSTYGKCYLVVLILTLWCPHISAQRDDTEATSWLKWNSKLRETYVVAYIQGNSDGYARGCQEGTRHITAEPQTSSDRFPVNQCIGRKLNFTKGIDLAKDVTAFYQRYPENRDLLIREILEELGKGKSLEEIHNNPPFPAISSVSKGGGARK